MRAQNYFRLLLRAFAILLLTLALAPLTGCQSSKGSSDGSLASVTVANRSQAEINAAILGVFRRNSFQGGMVSPGLYRFERAGSKMNQLAYGDLLGGGVAVRVHVTVTSLDTTSNRIACRAEIVQDPGDPIIEDAHKVRKYQSKPYQDLLNEVEARLK